MATNSIYSQMDNWSRTMLSRLEEKDPIFACHARNELSNIARAYPYGTFPQFYSPGPPSRAAPIFPSPRPAFTPLHSGGNPNGGVQGLPSDRPCFCGNLTACRCSSWCPPTPAPLPTSPPRPKSPFVTMNSGAGTPNTGVQGLPASSSCSNYGCRGTCRNCRPPTPGPPPAASFSSPFNNIPHMSPFANSRNPLPEPPRPSPFWNTLPTPPASQRASPARATPSLPHDPPDTMLWNFGSGTMAWSPHPAPHPGLPHNLDAHRANALTGGYPLPGTAPWWAPGIQPDASIPYGLQLNHVLVPNPCNSESPIMDWDLSTSPALAKFNASWEHCDLRDYFLIDATNPPQKEITVYFDNNHAQDLWGPIKVSNGGQNVLVWHVLTCIWEYFQTPIAPDELVALTEFDPANHAIILDAASRRCANTPGLPSWESTRGPRRIDMLGDDRKFWGFWISPDRSANGFHLNLGVGKI